MLRTELKQEKSFYIQKKRIKKTLNNKKAKSYFLPPRARLATNRTITTPIAIQYATLIPKYVLFK